MNDWWNSPVLYGDDNDYGQYDYMIEEIPEDYAKWELDKYKWKCDTCGKERHLRFCTCHHFHTLDGWDSMSYDECWKCRIECMISGRINYYKRNMRNLVEVIKWCLKNKSFKHWDLYWKIVRK